MASFCNVSILAFLLLATVAFLASPGMAFQANEQDYAPAPNENILVAPDVENYLVRCLKKLSKGCGPLFFERIFLNETKDLSTSCCHDMVQMGLSCHNAMTNAIILRPEFSDKAALYHKNRIHIWKLCNLLI